MLIRRFTRVKEAKRQGSDPLAMVKQGGSRPPVIQISFAARVTPPSSKNSLLKRPFHRPLHAKGETTKIAGLVIGTTTCSFWALANDGEDARLHSLHACKNRPVVDTINRVFID